MWALGLGLVLGLTPLARWKVSAFGRSGSPVDAFLGAFIMAHLVVVFFRSHANAEVRALHPVRFWVVPPALLLVRLASGPARTAAAALAEKGYRPPREKVVLHLGTAAVSVWAWGFNPLGMALFIMNFFHAWQYFALVWRYERENIAAVLRVPQGARGRAPAFALFVGLGFVYGSVFGVLGELSSKALAVTLVVSLMHFWYDGFVWSVRRNQV